MNHFGRVFALVLVISVAMAHRLPAPIQEEPGPTAKPEQSAKPKPKSTSKPKPKPPPKVFPFAGVWSGTTNNVESSGATGTSTFSIVISQAGRVTVRWILTQGGWSNPLTGQCSASGATASWNLEGTGDDGTRERRNYSLTLTSATTATFQGNINWVAGPNKGLTATQTGLLVKQAAVEH